MADSRVLNAAKLLVEHSTKVKKGDNVIISGFPDAAPIMKEIYRLCVIKGAHVTVKTILPELSHIFFKEASKEQLEHYPKLREMEVKEADVLINVGGDYNTREMTNIDPKKITLAAKIRNPISKIAMTKRWVGFDYPTNALAQDAGMSLEEYEDFVYGAITLDAKKMQAKLEKLAAVVNKASKVRLVGKDTDLTFTINGMTAKAEYCNHNVPDGEVFTAPNKYSVEGKIRFTYPAIKAGNEVENIYLEFQKGKVVKATADKNQEFLIAMLDTDEGSRYLGELGLGMNPNINKFTKNLLFDEKIGGTIHLALGMAYPECIVGNKKNGNDSALHWDIVKDFRTEGGEVYFDDKVVMKNGKWLIKF